MITADYVYDANGNMIEDKNKKITDIDYNYMNLPTSISPEADYCEWTYSYDTDGSKYEHTVIEDMNTQYEEIYAGG